MKRFQCENLRVCLSARLDSRLNIKQGIWDSLGRNYPICMKKPVVLEGKHMERSITIEIFYPFVTFREFSVFSVSFSEIFVHISKPQDGENGRFFLFIGSRQILANSRAS